MLTDMKLIINIFHKPWGDHGPRHIQQNSNLQERFLHVIWLHPPSFSIVTWNNVRIMWKFYMNLCGTENYPSPWNDPLACHCLTVTLDQFYEQISTDLFPMPLLSLFLVLLLPPINNKETYELRMKMTPLQQSDRANCWSTIQINLTICN